MKYIFINEFYIEVGCGNSQNNRKYHMDTILWPIALCLKRTDILGSNPTVHCMFDLLAHTHVAIQ
jgi:hypothetical protein